jgi:glutamate--cysteine ligase
VDDHERLRADVARIGLKAQVNGRSVQDVARTWWPSPVRA